MLASMTGFARATTMAEEINFNLEIRSLNGKYFKSTIKLPEQLACYEPRIEQIIRENLIRGSIVYTLRLRDNSAMATMDVNTGAIKGYLQAIKDIGGDQTLPNAHVDLSNILLLPGVCQYPEPDADQLERELQVIIELTQQALKKLWSMRFEEGQALREDLLKHCSRMTNALDQIKTRAPLVIQDYAQRLHLRVKKLLSEAEVELSQEDLAREVAVFAERADINEELSRLDSHLSQFRMVIDGKEHAGRTLEFLAQEMLRETNTIGSKANDALIAQYVVEIKGHIDRIKEQVMNVV
jgi:uncharacterized protein (TIGR00255 family)